LQANGVSDKVLDLRNCSYANEKEQLKGKVLASALLVGANFDNADLSESIMTKAYAAGASFKGETVGQSLCKVLSKPCLFLPAPRDLQMSCVSCCFLAF
jgi:uncharacterized protein YjbI with pentapeptide repeats